MAEKNNAVRELRDILKKPVGSGRMSVSGTYYQ